MSGKRTREDVQQFAEHLIDNIYILKQELSEGVYRHSEYKAFKIADPKPRDIHKASVRDRLLHHAIYRKLYPFFDRTFIADSYSCRKGKGVHRALNRFRKFALRASGNHTRTVWVLKCDIKKFFASIDHAILIDILKIRIADPEICNLLFRIIGSFSSGKEGIGLPLGNLTSQLLVNVYMNEFDQYVKHKLRAKYYIRYADDFVIMSHNREWLCSLLPEICRFLRENLKLELHPRKVSIATVASGIDFLGWVNFPNYRVLRTTTKRRMLKQVAKKDGENETIQSYLGLLRHGNAKKLEERIRLIMESKEGELDPRTSFPNATSAPRPTSCRS